MIDKEIMVNDDILFEDTGYNMRGIREQEFIAKIKELEEILKDTD